jgi:hypothetical protein
LKEFPETFKEGNGESENETILGSAEPQVKEGNLEEADVSRTNGEKENRETLTETDGELGMRQLKKLFC